MPLTGFGPGAKFLTAAPGFWAGTGAGVGAATGGKGILAALGLSNPWGWVATGIFTGLQILWKRLFKPKIEPLPVRSINITGGREAARHLFGRRRVDLEWTDATTLPGSSYRDNYKQFIACISEGDCFRVTRMWIDQELIQTMLDPADPTHLIPSPGNQFTLPADDVSRYNFPTQYAAELRYKFMAHGTQQELEDQAASARTDGNLRWEAPVNRLYNGNPGASDWSTTRTERTTEFFDPQPYCLDINGRKDFNSVEYDAQGNPFCRTPGDFDSMESAQYDTDPSGPASRKMPVALEVNRIDASYRLEGISWAQFNWFEPFYQQNDRSQKLYRAAPDVSVLVEGKLVTTPYSTTPVYSDNPAAILRWIDVHYRGIDESLIDADSYKAAYDHCEEEITYRYGTAVPDDSLGADGEFYARSDGRVYGKESGSWVDKGVFAGDYAWFSSQGTNGVYTMKRYRCNLEFEVGADIEQVYEKILACCGDGRRYEHNGRIHYRVGVDRPKLLDVTREDIWEVGDREPWMPVKQRVNKLSARLSQSEENDWLPDDVEYIDTAAVERDGETREAQFALDGETNPIRAVNLLKIQLGQIRASAVWPVRIGWMAGMAQRTIQPLDVISLTNSEHKWDRTPVQVLNVVHLPDRSVLCLCRNYDASIYGPTLSLPGIPRRPVNFAPSVVPLDLTGLRAYDRIDARHDSTRVITEVTWDPVVAETTEVRYQVLAKISPPLTGRWVFTGVMPVGEVVRSNFSPSVTWNFSGALPIGHESTVGFSPSTRWVFHGGLPIEGGGVSLWDPGVALDVARGLYYRETGLHPFTIGPGGEGHDAVSGNNRWGIWLQYQGPLPGDGYPGDDPPWRQMAFERAGVGIPILGTRTGTLTPIQFRRFGIFASNAGMAVGTPAANRTLLWVTALNQTGGGSAQHDFSSDQKRDWRFVMRDSGGATFIMNLPFESEDPANPYIWLDEQGTAFRRFLTGARDADRTVDFAIVNSASRYFDVDLQLALFEEDSAFSVLWQFTGVLPEMDALIAWYGYWDTRTAPAANRGLIGRHQGLYSIGNDLIGEDATGTFSTVRLYGGFTSAQVERTGVRDVTTLSSNRLQLRLSGTARDHGPAGVRAPLMLDLPGLTLVFYDRRTRTGVTVGPSDIIGGAWSGQTLDNFHSIWTVTLNSAKWTALNNFRTAHASLATSFEFAVVDANDPRVDLPNFRIRD